jgi:hypothetical protein
VVAAVLTKPTETANQYLYVSSFELTMNEFVGYLKKATGVHQWHIEYVKGEAQIKLGRDLMAQGKMWQGMAKLVVAVTVMGGMGNDFGTDLSLRVQERIHSTK